VVSTVTGADGRFVLRDVPVGASIPLVVQIGRWTREMRTALVRRVRGSLGFVACCRCCSSRRPVVPRPLSAGRRRPSPAGARASAQRRVGLR
jgi:hypothetical protein